MEVFLVVKIVNDFIDLKYFPDSLSLISLGWQNLMD